MANELTTSISQYKETFNKCRIYLAKRFNDKDKVIKLENAPISAALPFYVEYLESVNVNFLEAVMSMHYNLVELYYNDLVIATIIDLFRQIEAGNNVQDLPF